MALGGGNFTNQNKVIPGSYINFISSTTASAALSERGIAAIPMILDWGPEQEVLEVKAETIKEVSQNLFGYSYQHENMIPIREAFLHLQKGIIYRLNKGVKASNKYAQAKYSGVAGNHIKLVISANALEESKFDVKTFYDEKLTDVQTVSTAAELTANDWVIFQTDQTLEATAGLPMEGGTNGDAVTGEDYAAFLSKMESYSYHILCCPSAEDSIKSLFIAFTKRMRDQIGSKFQTVLYRKNDADYEGIISVENEVAKSDMTAGLVYWVTGIAASCAVNKSNENMVYDGELNIQAEYTQDQLAEGIRTGKFLMHKAGDQVRVLVDCNTLISVTEEKGKDFGSNQTIRVMDQIGNDIAVLFNEKYLGRIPNDESGRISFWNDLVTYYKKLETMRAIENFKADDVIVTKGEGKKSVVASCPVTPVNAMSQLYMTIIVQ